MVVEENKEAGEKRRIDDVQLALIVQKLEHLVCSNAEHHEAITKTNGEEHDRIFKKVKCIENSIKGQEGKPGILTKIALHDASLARVWWWLGSLSLAIMVAAIYIIRDHMHLMG